MFKRLAPVLLSLILLIGCGVSVATQSDEPSQLVIKQENEQSTQISNNDSQESVQSNNRQTTDNQNEPSYVSAVAPIASPTDISDSNAIMKVHFIDVGQADSILIQAEETSVLVDAGNNADGDLVVNYLKSQGVAKLAAVVATHPHEDHIGGMDTVLNSFIVEKFYMPNASSTSKTFEDMILAANASGAKKIQAKAGIVLDVPGITGTFLGPVGSSYDDLNNYSAVLKIIHGNISFLLTGDAEDISEGQMLKNGNLQATLLKIGHHGSDSSTTPEFLKAVSPKYAVISVGKGNTYGHPTDVVLSRLATAGVEVFRTDQSGTIVATSDGSTITFDKIPSTYQSNVPLTSTNQTPPITTPNPPSTTASSPIPATGASTQQHYIINTSTKKFHYPNCRSLPTKNKGEMYGTRDDMINAGYSPCGICKP